MKNLQKNKTYKNFGNIFSKTLLIQKSFELESFLFITESEKNLKKYLKISKFLNFSLFQMINFCDFIQLYFDKNTKFIICKDFFYLKLDNFENFVDKNTFKIKIGQNITPTDLSKKLSELNINFSEYEHKNTFNIKGDTLSFFNNISKEIKVSFWGDEIEKIFYEKKEIKNYIFALNKKLSEFSYVSKINKEIVDFCKKEEIFCVFDELDYYSFYDYFIKNYYNFLTFSSIGSEKNIVNLGFSDLVINSLEDFKSILQEKNTKKIIFTKNEKTIKNFLELNNLSKNIEVKKTELNILKSFTSSLTPFFIGEENSKAIPLEKLNSKFVASEKANHGQLQTNYYICDDNISRIFIKRRTKKTFAKNLDLFLQIKPGDFTVHIDHGIGIFKEIIEKNLAGIKKEYIEIDYKGDDKLFVPITEVGRVSKYVGSENPKLTKLSTNEWDKKLKKVSEDVEKIASDLLEIYAKRKLQKGHIFLSLKDEESKFLNSFEYVYTEDQISAINDIFKDMEAEISMDRLVCGDVGFGKTEVAFASIFKCLANEKQAALISPLVVLAYEHFESAKSRFANFPFNIEVLTRFETEKTTKTILKKLKEGKIDLIIGTHKLLSENVEFKDLGLLIIDEEHKFGVKDKEKIKKLKGNIDILSMSATPIPRSLNMALNGLKQISMIRTAPIGKKSVETIVSDFNDKVIFEAAKKEFARNGQIFFIHNRVETILGVQSYLEKLLPGKKIIIAHGQLSGDRLENVIIDFKKKKYDILLSTTVIENGIDFKNVNTIFINDSINFGISQIHQLRGRVGRGSEKGYCYLLFKKDKIKEDAAKRLKTIVDYSHLGAGFELAVKDLEIRGGGDILGIRQSGSASEVGINLFLEMLENKIEELKNKKDYSEKNILPKSNFYTKIDLNLEAYISSEFFTSELDKINFYRELESINSMEILENIIIDFKNINENIPKPTKNFFDLLKLKILAKKYNISSIKKSVGIYRIDFSEIEGKTEKIEKFIKMDKKIKFQIVSLKILKSPIKNFTSEEKFVEYLLEIFSGKIRKIKLKK